MKFFSILAGFLLLAGCATSGGVSSEAINIDGTFRGQVAGGGGGMGGAPMEITYNFKVDGDTLKGTVSGGPNQWIPIKDGKIDGDEISFTVDVDYQGMKMTFDYKGKIKDNDTIKMSYNMKMGGGGGFGGGMGGPGGGGGKITVKRIN